MEKQNYKFTVTNRRTGKEIELKNSLKFYSITEEKAKGIRLGLMIGIEKNVEVKVETFTED